MRKVQIKALMLLTVLLGVGVSLSLAATSNHPLLVTMYSDAVRFTTRLQEASTLQVEVFDLQGARLFDSGPISNRATDWRLSNQNGVRVANGVYLYVVTVWNTQGQQLSRKLGKLAVVPGAMGVSAPLLPIADNGNSLGLDGEQFAPNSAPGHHAGLWTYDQVGVGTTTISEPLALIEASKNATGPTIMIRNEGGAGGAQFRMKDDASGADFKFKSTGVGGFKIRDQANGIDVITIPSATGQVGIGTASPLARLDIVGTDADLIRAADAASPANAVFRVTKTGNVFADGSFSGGGADVAEYVETAETLEPGDVVEVDPDNAGKFRKARGAQSVLVAGVISTAPGVTLGNNFNGKKEQWEHPRPLLALAGRVPVKVATKFGAIEIGDLLVSSPIPGYAMKCPEVSQCIGAIVGKALESLKEGVGKIEAQVMLR